MNDLNTQFSDFLTSWVNFNPPFANADFENYNNRIKDAGPFTTEKSVVIMDFTQQYGIKREDRVAMQDWVSEYAIDKAALAAAVDKIPNFEGIVLRHTQLSSEDLDMLRNFGTSPRTTENIGQGVYNVRGKN